MTVNGREDEALDVWLRFTEDDDYAEAEANTFYDAENEVYRVEWYLNAVGLVKEVEFPTYEAATAWLTEQGFDDYTVED